MTSSADASAVADSSFAVPLLLRGHSLHDRCTAAADTHRPSLAGHAWFETYSVLTRLDDRRRVSPATAEEVLRASFPIVVWLSARDQQRAARHIVGGPIVGGAVYDALVAAAALAADRPLLTLDRRALRTYEAMGVEVVLLE